MNDRSTLTRSPELLDGGQSVLLVVDVQTKLLDLMAGAAGLVWNVSRLLRGAQVLEVPVSATVQYPQKLGGVSERLAPWLREAESKRAFSCLECEHLARSWAEQQRRQIVLCGMESHVCVLQSAADLLSEGFRVYLVADAIGARGQADHDWALRRAESLGASIVTTEMALMEWCRTSLHPQFKQISDLLKEAPPK